MEIISPADAPTIAHHTRHANLAQFRRFSISGNQLDFSTYLLFHYFDIQTNDIQTGCGTPLPAPQPDSRILGQEFGWSGCMPALLRFQRRAQRPIPYPTIRDGALAIKEVEGLDALTCAFVQMVQNQPAVDRFDDYQL